MSEQPIVREPRGPAWRPFAHLSIERKLPLLIGTLLLAVIAIYAGAAFQAVRRATFAAARERLISVTGQLAELLRGSATQLKTATRKVAADAAVTAYLRSPDPRSRAKAIAALETMGPQPEQIAEVQLWDAHGKLLLRAHQRGPHIGPHLQTDVVPLIAGNDSGAVGRFRAVGDSIVYPVVARVASRGQTVGCVAQWRRIASSPQARQQTLQLIGSGAALYLGNDQGDFWTDLMRMAPKPPMDVRQTRGVIGYERPDGGPVLALAQPVPGTPWVVLIEFPRRVVSAQVQVFLGTLAVIAIVLIVAGLGGAWMLSRRIAVPLRQLTGAAAEIAAGNYSHPVAVDRDDELGRLAQAFNTMAGHVRDSQHRLEEQVRERTAELQERNEELEAFGYSISHDLRAPLRAMHGFSQALLEDYGGRLDPTGREYAERIVTAARRMEELIRDLLAYSRLARAELKFSPVALTQVIQEATAQLESQLRTSGARLSVVEPLPSVIGHGPTLAQVVANLLGNGIKFAAPGRVAEVRISADARDGRVRLWVEDNGIGIPPQYHERIFGVFQRLHKSEDYPGTGIGLAIVRKSMERMGGQVGLESTPGEGSRFWIELPLAG